MIGALPFIAAGASLLKGFGGYAAGQANSRAAREAAREKRGAAAAQGRRVREDARRKIGEQLAAMAGSGMMGASAGGSALDALRQSQIEAALDVMELRRQGAAEGRALDMEARQAKRAGQFALLEGVLGAGSSYVGMKQDWAQVRNG